MVNAQFLQSHLFRGAGFSHAFFTRRGGVSEGPFESLNFSISVGDAADRVEENLQRAALALGVSRPRLYFASQVHGTDVYEVMGGSHPERVVEERADVVMSAIAGVASAVRTADCVPVLFADERSGMVAAAHAGWRGLVRGVLASAVQRLLERGCRVDELLVAVGPHISVEAFEVSPEVAWELQEATPGRNVVRQQPGRRPHCDLRAVAHAQLVDLGVSAARLDDVHGCTVGQPHDFFSYRRDGQRSGRLLSAVVARG